MITLYFIASCFMPVPRSMGAMTAREIRGQCGQGDRFEALQQQRFGVGKRCVERGIDHLLDEA